MREREMRGMSREIRGRWTSGPCPETKTRPLKRAPRKGLVFRLFDPGPGGSGGSPGEPLQPSVGLPGVPGPKTNQSKKPRNLQALAKAMEGIWRAEVSEFPLSVDTVACLRPNNAVPKCGGSA